MKPIFRFFAERHTFATLLLVMVLLLGSYSLLNTRRSLYPRVDLGELIINTPYPGAAPEDVELNVTNKLEDAIRGVSGLKRVTSTSMENISSIHIVLDEDAAPPDETIDRLRDAVARVTNFPAEVTESPQIIELKTAEMPIIEVAVVSDAPYPELRRVAKDLEKKLRNVPGVAKLKRFGFRDREVQVELNPDKLREHQIPLREIVMAIEARNIRSAGGTFESYTSEKNLVTLAQFDDPMQVEEVIVRSTFEGPRLRIKDLAEIKDGYEAPKIESRMNAHRAISFLVKKSEGADIIRTVDAIESMLAVQRESLPANIEITSAADYSRFVRNRFDVVQSNGLIGLGLVAIILWAFLNFQTAIWVALGIPFCLLGMLFSLNALDYDLDVISLAGFIIVLGIIVDDAIIVSENIFRRYELGDSPVDAAVNGLNEVFRPVLTTLLTTLCAFAPMFFMTGIMGKFIFVIPLVVSLALLASLVEVTTALPAHLVPGLTKRQSKGESHKTASSWFEPIRRVTHRAIRITLTGRYLMVLAAFSYLAGSVWYAKNHMDFVLFPASSAEEFHILAELPGGSSLAATSDSMKVFEDLIETLPKEEVNSFVTRIGRWGVEFPVDGEQYGTVQVTLTPFSMRSRTADQIVEDLRERSRNLPGFENILYHVKAGGPPVGAPIEIRVVNADDEQRARLTNDVFNYVQSIDGAVDLDRDDRAGKQQVQIHLDYDKLSSLGLTVADVAQNVRIAFDGQAVTNIRYGDEDVEFRVVLEERARRDNTYLMSLLIPNNQGRLVALEQVAKLKLSDGNTSFEHYDFERAVTITGDVDKTITTPIKVMKAVKSHFNVSKDYPGSRIIVGGEAQETQDSVLNLFGTFAIAGIAIYCILILLFNSAVQPILVMVSIPVGVAAVIITFALHGQPLGFLAFLGVIGLSGVVVNDSLVLVSHINDLRERAGPNDNILDQVALGTANRLRAILMTTITTVLGLVPLAYGWGGSDPFMAPMALAIGYGLLFATPLTVILVPCLYVIGWDIGKILGKLMPTAKREELNPK